MRNIIKAGVAAGSAVVTGIASATNLVPAASLTSGITDLTDTATGLFTSLLPVALTIAVLGVAYRMAKSWFKKAG